MKKLITLISLAFICVNVFSQTTDRYWSGTGAISDNINQDDNWHHPPAGHPDPGDNIYFNNTTGTRHWPYTDYGGNSYFNFIITYSGAGGIRWRGDRTYAYKFENFNDPNVFEIEGDIDNRGGSDVEINPVGSGGINILAASTVTIESGKIIKVYGSNTLTVDGDIAGGGGITLPSGNSPIVILKNSNSYSGATTISGGKINIQHSNALGTTGSGTTVASDFALEIQGGISTAEPLTISGTGIGSSGAIRNISGSNSITATVQLNAESYIQSDAGTLTLSATNSINAIDKSLTLKGAGDGIVSGTITTGTGTLSKSNGGKWTLTGANTYTGATSITGGVLNIQNATALGTTAGGVTVSAALELQNNITVGNESLSLTGGGISSNGALRNISGTNEYQGAITLTGNTIIQCDAGTLNLTNANTITGTNNLNLEGASNINITGIISTSTGTITKNDAGTVTLTGVNTYTGLTTITGGVLILANTSGTSIPATNNITVSGGTLRISENQTINNLTLSGGSLLIDAGKTLTINGTYNAGSSTSTVTNNGTIILNSTSNFPGSNAAVTAGFNNLNINAAITLNNNLTVEGIFNLIGGTFDVNNKTLTLNNAVAATSGTLTSSPTGTVIYNQSADGQNVLAGTYGILTLNNYNKVLSSSGTINIIGGTTCFNPGTATGHTVTGSTIAFTKDGDQDIPSFIYNNISFDGLTTAVRDKNVLGTLTILGNVSITGKARISAIGKTIIVSGDWTSSSTATSNGYNAGSDPASLVEFNGSGTRSFTHAGGATFRNLTFSGTGTYTMNNDMNVQVLVTISNGTFTFGTNRLYGTGNLTMSSGLLQLGRTSVTLPGLDGATYNLSGGTIELNGAGDQILRGSKSYANLTFSNSGTKTLTSAIGAPSNTISGTVTISDAAILNVSNNTFGSATTNLTMTGTSKFIIEGSDIKPDIGGTYSLGIGTTIEFAGTSSTNPRVLSISYYNVIVSGTNVNITGTTDGLTFQSGGSFTVKSNAVFAFANTNGFSGNINTAINNTTPPTITLEPNSTIGYRGVNQTVTNGMPYVNLKIGAAGIKTLAGNITVGGNLDLSAGELAATTYTITVSGNILGTATQTNTSGKISMTGASASISGATLGNLELNNINGFSLSGSPTINGVLTFTLGKLTMGANNITLASNAVGAIAGYSNTKYFVTDGAGFVRRAVTGPNAYDFPVGSSSNYNPAKITWTGASGSTQVSNRFIGTQAPNPIGLTSNAYGTENTPITEFLNNGYWEFTSTSTPSAFQLDLTTAGGTALAPLAQQHSIFRNPTLVDINAGTGWDTEGTPVDIWLPDTAASTSGFGGIITPRNTGVVNLGFFAIGRSASYVLPIVLTEFTAELIDADVVLNWITASEVNNDYFSIQRSMDGSIWNAIGQVDGAGSSSTVNHYDFTDKDAPGMVLYYRLKQIDFNGNYEYSPIRVVNNLGNEAYIIYGYYTLTGQQIETLENAPTGIYLQLSNKGNTKIFHNE
ncbi:MAG: autotransporter-associated beta strand repeat-containing protein [Chitinophagales bacterium]